MVLAIEPLTLSEKKWDYSLTEHDIDEGQIGR